MTRLSRALQHGLVDLTIAFASPTSRLKMVAKVNKYLLFIRIVVAEAFKASNLATHFIRRHTASRGLRMGSRP
jgi:hypothetical protein